MFSEKRQPKDSGLQDSWKAFVDRFELLASTVSSTAGAVVKREGELAAMRRELETRIGNIETFVTRSHSELRSSMASSSKEVAAPPSNPQAEGDDKRVARLTEEIEVLSQRLHSMAETVEMAAAGVASHEGKLNALSKRLEARTNSGRAEVDEALKHRLKDIAQAMTATTRGLDAQAAEIATVRSMLDASDGALQHRDQEFQQTIAALVSRVDAIEHRKEGTAPPDLDERLSEMRGAIDEVVSRVDAITVSLDSALAGVAEKEHELAALHRHFAESSARLR